MIKDWILTAIARYILEQIANGGVTQLGDKVENFILPAMTKWKADLITRLKEEARTQTPDLKLDDVLVDALDVFLTAMLPKASPGKAVVSK